MCNMQCYTRSCNRPQHYYVIFTVISAGWATNVAPGPEVGPSMKYIYLCLIVCIVCNYMYYNKFYITQVKTISICRYNLIQVYAFNNYISWDEWNNALYGFSSISHFYIISTMSTIYIARLFVITPISRLYIIFQWAPITWNESLTKWQPLNWPLNEDNLLIHPRMPFHQNYGEIKFNHTQLLLIYIDIFIFILIVDQLSAQWK